MSTYLNSNSTQHPLTFNLTSIQSHLNLISTSGSNRSQPQYQPQLNLNHNLNSIWLWHKSNPILLPDIEDLEYKVRLWWVLLILVSGFKLSSSAIKNFNWYWHGVNNFLHFLITYSPIYGGKGYAFKVNTYSPNKEEYVHTLKVVTFYLQCKDEKFKSLHISLILKE